MMKNIIKGKGEMLVVLFLGWYYWGNNLYTHIISCSKTNSGWVIEINVKLIKS